MFYSHNKWARIPICGCIWQRRPLTCRRLLYGLGLYIYWWLVTMPMSWTMVNDNWSHVFILCGQSNFILIKRGALRLFWLITLMFQKLRCIIQHKNNSTNKNINFKSNQVLTFWFLLSYFILSMLLTMLLFYFVIWRYAHNQTRS